ncbi:hypothetical protein [Sphaerisporangium sp. TRM90804]|uniref:phage tail assembly protein T n=1 Tax=Sphaerisporangium sp. TRM90804 TaxID=3031113 RepID=UPI00244B0C01|nr:hypothetical protein [Sphaerisporangium sp. TRM90804]MDH2429313.1 hypothetical protein [Sphaerisporangium sp. TRM90804]
MPVSQMLQQVSGRTLAEWEAYEHLYGPIGVEARVDRAAALIAQQLANAFRPPKTREFAIEDFLPNWAGRPLHTEGDAGGWPAA